MTEHGKKKKHVKGDPIDFLATGFEVNTNHRASALDVGLSLSPSRFIETHVNESHVNEITCVVAGYHQLRFLSENHGKLQAQVGPPPDRSAPLWAHGLWANYAPNACKHPALKLTDPGKRLSKRVAAVQRSRQTRRA
jgi:hypothetical protein